MEIHTITQLKEFDINNLLYPNIKTTLSDDLITCETFRLIKNDNIIELIEFRFIHELRMEDLKHYDYERHVHWIKEDCTKKFKADVERYKP